MVDGISQDAGYVSNGNTHASILEKPVFQSLLGLTQEVVKIAFPQSTLI